MAKKRKSGDSNEVFSAFPFNITHITGSFEPPMVDGKGKPLDYKDVPTLLSDNVVGFQFMHFPLPLTPENEALLEMSERDRSRFVLGVKLNSDNGNPKRIEYVREAVMARVVKIIDLDDSNRMALIQTEERVRIARLQEDMGLRFPVAIVAELKEFVPTGQSEEFELTVDMAEDTFKRFMMAVQPDDGDNSFDRQMIEEVTEEKKDYRHLLNKLCLHAPIEFKERVELLKCNDMLKRATLLLKYLNKAEKLLIMRHTIFRKANEEISQAQKEQFLQSQIKMLTNELNGGEDNDIRKFEERAAKKQWSEHTREFFKRELNKLGRFNPSSPDYSVQYGYLETLLSLPWDEVRRYDIDLNKLSEDLDKDHFGLEKVKERIMEHIAVLKLRGDMRSPILCLYGPPGVGKTSLCKSIADSIGREYVRMSLGGVHDEAEIRGHRRTYIGAMPGRIINALTKCESNDPVFVLDEIDKIGKDYKGDPAQALLEVLDPEQNSKFHDNYLDIDYDLSKIFFIATANSISTISPPLLDRMELIDVSGYIVEEKMEIARRHLIPKQLEEHGFGKNEIKFQDDAIKLMIESYTRESGVRILEKVIARLLRKLAVKKAKGEKYRKTITARLASELLGKPEILPNVYESDYCPGVATGLAWTAAGGEILYIESSLSKGKGNLTLTGNLGDVMKESATIALQWLRGNAAKLGIDTGRFAETDAHVHVPEGAVPKDGPSAGITILTSLASAFTGRKVKKGIAMTGELTLRGKVLPVGGIKEKILSAKRAGLKEIILSKQNIKDIEEIDGRYLEGLEFRYVDTADEVMEYILDPIVAS